MKLINFEVNFLNISSFRYKKRQLASRADRASYINHGYEQTEVDPIVRKSEGGSINSKSGHVPPAKPTRRTSSKKSQNACYVNIEISPNKNGPEENQQFSVKSLPRNVNDSVMLVVPNLTTNTSSMGSSIPYIDASKENLDIISDQEKKKIAENSENNNVS